ncbi:dehydrogenase [Oleiphilus sp. HI0079]|uniref:molybdopterin-dependent oxidoreductase n=3 Tax=unclassified Oleiphilus TaxID=2631174 RepID=UPI0007C3FE0D|nr:molybdopterin-dependent oxidoreductase [Oleiphilus sp. HI0079]KZZ09732.1 dehydrogenase [Oleiphilus sp. HI0079]
MSTAQDLEGAIITHKRACHLCEAICGLTIKTKGEEILEIKGDPEDPFSRGHICPKAIALQDLHEDPDRLRKPMKRVGQDWQEISWQAAFEEIAKRTAEIQAKFGNDSVAVYAGNPNVHNYGNLTHGRLLRKALATKSNFSATSLDQLPHHFVAMHLFGHQFLVPVPDIDRTDYMLIFGANPVASNGSMMTVPDVKNRLKAIQKRGGKFVVVDPRRSETAALADEHLFVKPSADVYVLLAFLKHVISKVENEEFIESVPVVGLSELTALVAPFSFDLAERKSGVSAADQQRVIEEFMCAPTAVLYGRMGVSVQQYGTICQWAIHLINLLTGNLDRPGGAMFPSSAVGYVRPGEPSPGHFARYHTRVSGLPEFAGEFPSTALAEEILTPGDGQFRALYTLAGNPVLSAPNGRQLDTALESLDLMVALDFYLNETTRHADYILPPTGPLEHDHYDVAFFRLAIRDVARFNSEVFPRPEGALHDWEILSGLAKALSDAKQLSFKPLVEPKMLMDMGMQMGPYGKSAGSEYELSLETLKKHPSGIDLGPLKPGLSQRICTADKAVQLVIHSLVDPIKALSLDAETEQNTSYDMRLIGRRHVRSNNSWMHNSHRLVKGPVRYHALVHPSDMERLGIEDCGLIEVETRVGKERVAVKASDEVMQGVVSIPHGWGHNRSGTRLNIAEQHAGVSVNDLVDDKVYDPVTGNAALNGVLCRISAVD